jgi:hypothetical protein
VAANSEQSIWALLREASETLPEPFTSARLIDFVSRRRPDVAEASIRTHINYALVETTRTGPWASRTPFLTRVDRGVYRRSRAASRAEPAPSRPPSPVPRSVPVTARSSGRVVLVGCSRTKRPGAAPASELFEGALFRRARDHAIRSGDAWFVLSARFGLLDPAEVVEPYDVYLGDRSPSYRTAWGEWVVAQLAERVPLDGLDVEVHAGDAYCAPLREPLRRAGARLSEPLAGLRQGERLAWARYHGVPDDARPAGIDVLLDPARAVSPDAFLAKGSEGLTAPGLYTWWVDDAGAADLTRGTGHPVAPGLVYAGKAGGHRPDAVPSTATLWGRISGNHLRGNVRSSTLRRSLAALLRAAGLADDEDAVTRWMHEHLRVAVLPVASEDVASLEDELVAGAKPPLNLAGLPRDEARSALGRLRGLLRDPGAPRPEPQTVESPAQEPARPESDADDAARAFDRRIRSDLDAIVRAGYRPTQFQRMLSEHGAVGTAQRLLAASQISDGFRWLWEHRMLQHSVENAVLHDAFVALFSPDERSTAERRLRDAGFG